MTFLEVRDVHKVYDAQVAVDSVSFDVERGEILTLLGPSGCGKTTTLRCIAGLETPTAGTICLDGQTVTSVVERRLVAPERRNVGMVFQSYAVWPHMTVAQNLNLPLQVRHVPADERRQRIAHVLEMVGLNGLGAHYPTRLSGGQQQRIALARALIYNPTLLLLDEPLSNLDAKLREQMRHEIRRLQREVGITSVYVTRDQAEAMIISDRIIVMNCGRIEQEGDARSLYTRPATAFVATFLGTANLVHGVVRPERSDSEERVCVQLVSEDGTGDLLWALAGEALVPDQEVYLCIRPEDVLLRATPPITANVLCGSVQTVTFMGNFVEYEVRAPGHNWRVQTHPHETFKLGDEVSLVLPPEHCLCLPHRSKSASAPRRDPQD